MRTWLLWLVVGCTALLGVGALLYGFIPQVNERKQFSLHSEKPVLWDKTDERLQILALSTSASLPPHLHHPGITVATAEQVPFDGWIVGIDPIEIEGGPPDVLHHMNLINMSRISPLCGTPEHFYAVGQELTVALFPQGYAYPVFAGEELHARTMFHNHGSEAVTATASIRFLYLPAEEASESITPIAPLFFDDSSSAVPCELSDFWVPPGLFTYRSNMPYQVPVASRVIVAGGHMHAHAEKLVLERNGMDLIAFPLTLARDRVLEAVGVVYPPQIVLDAGDQLSVRGVYDNQSDAAIDGMAMVFLYLELLDEL